MIFSLRQWLSYFDLFWIPNEVIEKINDWFDFGICIRYVFLGTFIAKESSSKECIQDKCGRPLQEDSVDILFTKVYDIPE